MIYAEHDSFLIGKYCNEGDGDADSSARLRAARSCRFLSTVVGLSAHGSLAVCVTSAASVGAVETDESSCCTGNCGGDAFAGARRETGVTWIMFAATTGASEQATTFIGLAAALMFSKSGDNALIPANTKSSNFVNPSAFFIVMSL